MSRITSTIIIGIALASFYFWQYATRERPLPEKIYYLENVVHDGHLFVSERRASSKSALVHHPDCDCRKNQQPEQ